MSRMRILCVSQNASELAQIFDDAHIEVLDWPETGMYGPEVRSTIEAACSRVRDVGSIDCVIGMTAPCAPVLYQLRRSGYTGPLVLVPHVNPYPLRMFLHILLAAQVWGSADLLIAGSRSSANLYECLFGMRTCVMPTFGIDPILFTRRDQRESREVLGLPNVPLIAYSGRLARDKNIGALLGAYEALRRTLPAVRLILCVQFIDESYLRRLGPNLGDAILLRDIRQEKMPSIYSAADLFVSCATSYYETFGKSPLESVACGTPVVVPAWNGFREYIDSEFGKLVSVDFFTEPLYDPWSYAMVDLPKFVETCVQELQAPRFSIPPLDPRLSFAEAQRRMRNAVHDLLGKESAVSTDSSPIAVVNDLVRQIIEAMKVTSSGQLLYLATSPGERLPLMDEDLRREFYFKLFH